MSRYFKIVNEEYIYDGKINFEEADTIEAYDHELAAEKYAEEYYDNRAGEWDQDDPIKLHVVEILKERTYDDREQPKIFDVAFTYEPSFYTNEITKG